MVDTPVCVATLVLPYSGYTRPACFTHSYDLLVNSCYYTLPVDLASISAIEILCRWGVKVYTDTNTRFYNLK